MWDTSGKEGFRTLLKYFINDSHCVILGYDITNKRSFNEIKNYHYNNVKNLLGDDLLIYLVANKIDLFEYEQVSEKEAIGYAKEKGIKYFRISCETGEGIKELLKDIVDSLIMKFKKVEDNKDKELIRKIKKDGAKKILNNKKKFETEKKVTDNKDKIIIKEKINDEKKIKRLNRLNNGEKIEIILNKYYNY